MAFKAILIALCLFGVAQCSVLRSYQPDIRYVKLQVDGKEYNLNLKQSERPVVEDNVPIYVLKSDEEKGHTLTELEYENRRINGLFYNDDEYMATLLARYDEKERNAFYDGLLSPGSDVHVVKSAPEDWWREPEVTKSSEDKDENEQTDENQDKEVSQESEQTDGQKDDEDLNGEKQDLKLRSAYVSGEKTTLLENPLSVLKPKILVSVDYPLYKKLGEDINEVFTYVATYFNAVNLRFSKLNSIDVEISVTGVVIVTDEKVDQVLKDKEYFAGKFIEETEFANYDATFALTTSDAEVLTGKVHLGSICNRLFSTVYENDDATYGGLLHTIHDLAHLLNVPHDGVGESQQCSAENTVMAESKQSAEVLQWSECSNKVIKDFAATTAAECLAHSYRYE